MGETFFLTEFRAQGGSGLVAFAGKIALVLLFAIPYYAITKKPEIQPHGIYKLNEVKDKRDDRKSEEQNKNS